MIGFNEILSEINQFGVYQKCQLAFICMASLITPMVTYVNIFIMPNLDHKCLMPNMIENSTQMAFMNSEEKCFTQVNETAYHCTSWEFDHEYYRSTLTEEWSLVCQWNFLRAKIQTVFFMGFAIGSPLLGKLADKIGRRPVVLISVVLINLGCFGSAFGVQDYFGFWLSYTIFIFSGFITAIGTRGIDESGYVLALELIGTKYKPFSGVLIDLFFANGHMVIVILAFFFREWRYLSMSVFIFVLPFLSFFFLITESPRWLVSMNRLDEAFVILKNVAKWNKRTLSDQKWEKFCLKEREQTRPEKETLKSTYKNPYFISVLIGFVLMGTVCNVIFFGLGLKTNDLGVNPYMSFAFAAFLEVLACVFGFMVINKYGRRGIYFSCVFFGGIVCIASTFSDYVGLNLVFAMAFKFATTVSYCVMRLYGSEVFPTTIRVTCISIGAVISRIAVLFIPFVNSLGETVWKNLPFLIYGCIGISGAFVIFLLPETLGKEPIENLEEFMISFSPKNYDIEKVDDAETAKFKETSIDN